MGSDDTPLVTYSCDLRLKLFQPTHHVSRPTRKALFAAGLWRPYIGRLYACLHVMWPETPPPDLSSDTAPAQPRPSSSSLCQGLRVATWNIHSMRKKYIAVSDAILSHELDILVLTGSTRSLPVRGTLDSFGPLSKISLVGLGPPARRRLLSRLKHSSTTTRPRSLPSARTRLNRRNQPFHLQPLALLSSPRLTTWTSVA